MPHGDYHIPELTPVMEARGKGRPVDTENIQQFGGGSIAAEFEQVFKQGS
jgi:hypothetical protein